jgi:hypothetical protein
MSWELLFAMKFWERLYDCNWGMDKGGISRPLGDTFRFCRFWSCLYDNHIFSYKTTIRLGLTERISWITIQMIIITNIQNTPAIMKTVRYWRFVQVSVGYEINFPVGMFR